MAKKEEAKEADDAKDEKEDKKAKKKGKQEEGEEKPEGEEGAEGEGAPKKSKKKIIIMGVVALVVLLAGGGGGFYYYHSHKSAETAGDTGGKESGEKAVFYTLPEFLVNLNTGGKAVSYLKTTIVLQVAHQTDVPLIEANLPKLFDTLNTYMRELRASDLSGSAGIQRLREELLARANKVLWPVKVDDVLFKEIVVQ